MVWNTEDPYIYLRTTDDGRILIGGEDEEFRNPEKRDSLITNKEQKLLQSFQNICLLQSLNVILHGRNFWNY